MQTLFPKGLQDGLNAYEKVAKWMFAAYTLAFWITLAEIVLGIFAIFSRWGSFVTTIASTVSLLPAFPPARRILTQRTRRPPYSSSRPPSLRQRYTALSLARSTRR